MAANRAPAVTSRESMTTGPLTVIPGPAVPCTVPSTARAISSSVRGIIGAPLDGELGAAGAVTSARVPGEGEADEAVE